MCWFSTGIVTTSAKVSNSDKISFKSVFLNVSQIKHYTINITFYALNLLHSDTGTLCQFCKSLAI